MMGFGVVWGEMNGGQGVLRRQQLVFTYSGLIYETRLEDNEGVFSWRLRKYVVFRPKVAGMAH